MKLLIVQLWEILSLLLSKLRLNFSWGWNTKPIASWFKSDSLLWSNNLWCCLLILEQEGIKLVNQEATLPRWVFADNKMRIGPFVLPHFHCGGDLPLELITGVLTLWEIPLPLATTLWRFAVLVLLIRSLLSIWIEFLEEGRQLCLWKFFLVFRLFSGFLFLLFTLGLWGMLRFPTRFGWPSLWAPEFLLELLFGSLNLIELLHLLLKHLLGWFVVYFGRAGMRAVILLAEPALTVFIAFSLLNGWKPMLLLLCDNAALDWVTLQITKCAYILVQSGLGFLLWCIWHTWKILNHIAWVVKIKFIYLLLRGWWCALAVMFEGTWTQVL